MRGPLPSHRPVFPSTCLEEAEKIVRQRVIPYHLRQRAALVLLLSQHPLVSNIDAATQVPLPACSVQRWRRRWPRATFPWTTSRDGAARPIFPPLDHALVQAVAGALVAATQQPLRRQALADVTARAGNALGTPISRSPVWRILHTDAIKPWRYKYWIFPRDPHLVALH